MSRRKKFLQNLHSCIVPEQPGFMKCPCFQLAMSSIATATVGIPTGHDTASVLPQNGQKSRKSTNSQRLTVRTRNPAPDVLPARDGVLRPAGTVRAGNADSLQAPAPACMPSDFYPLFTSLGGG
jgi:hypothetical protein